LAAAEVDPQYFACVTVHLLDSPPYFGALSDSLSDRPRR
jgi:hypothetical protein